MKSLPMAPTDNPVLLRAALNLSGNGVMLFDCLRTATGAIHDFRLILANHPAEEIIGKSEQEILGQSMTDLFPEKIELKQNAEQVIDTGDAYKTELSCQHSNHSSESWYSVLLQKHGDGLAVSFSDITGLKQEANLIESVLNGSINGMIAYEAIRDETGQLQDLRIRLANDAAARITGVPLEQMVNDTMANQYPTVYASGLFDRYHKTVETGEAQRFESLYTFDGLNAWFDLAVSKLGDGMLLTFMDITAAKRYEQELQKLINNLKQSNENLERFAYITSHDLQEPLRKILSFGDMLRNQPSGALDEYNLNLITRMQSAATRMNTLIHDLLTFSRLSSEKRTLQQVNLQEVLDDVLIDLETSIREKQALIDVTTLPAVQGDTLQLRQLFQNLLSNSLKFVPPGTVPRIRVDCEQLTGRDIIPLPNQKVAEIDLDQPFFAISIVDNGIGFDEKYLDRIFTVFQRLHTRREYQGTGIGLTIVQKVIENQAGYIGAHSQPGNGATFTVYLPDQRSLEDQIQL
jgi:signal transduction histidine kinase